MDLADLAQRYEHQPVAHAIAKARAAKPQITPDGRCHNCQALVAPGHLYCDTDCRDDHEHRTRRASQ